VTRYVLIGALQKSKNALCGVTPYVVIGRSRKSSNALCGDWVKFFSDESYVRLHMITPVGQFRWPLQESSSDAFGVEI